MFCKNRKMLFIFCLFPQIYGIGALTPLKGFALLDPRRKGHVPAEDSVVQAITPFSTQLSLCYWFNQKWHGHWGGFELRTNLTQKRKNAPSDTNWPSLYGFGDCYVGHCRVGFMGVKFNALTHEGKLLKTDKLGLNFARKWMHYCFSLDFKANEMQIAVNGDVLEKVVIQYTEEVYKDQLGGSEILKETDDSNFFFAFGRYFFDDKRSVIEYAGVNAWNHTLNESELAILSSCKQHSVGKKEGNLLNSNTNWIYPENDILIEESEYGISLCTERNNENVVPLPIPLDTKENVVDICKKFGSDVNLGGTIRGVEDIVYFREVIFASKLFEESCGSPTGGRYYVWLPYHYDYASNGTLVHDVTGEEYTHGFFSPQIGGHGMSKGDVNVIAYMGNMVEMDARLYGAEPGETACGMCLIPTSFWKTTVIKLRGVCKYSAFDKQYQVTVTESGEIVYYGIKKTILQYNYTLLAWQMTDVTDPSITATFESGFESMALGTNMWRINNDFKCQKGELSIPLSLSACKDTQFTCGDGLCIDIDERCNGVTNCKDKTDELECKIVQMDSSYNQLLSPPPGEGREKVEVIIDVTINSFNSFDITESNFEVQMVLGMSWFDARLNYNNLRQKMSKNIMGPNEKNSIWFPTLLFENTKQKLKSIIDGEALVMVERNGSGKAVDDTFTENTLLYRGHENSINYQRLDNIKFSCLYQLQWYPFDSQKCEAVLSQPEIMMDYVDQIAGNFTYKGPRDLTMYFIKKTDMALKRRDGRPVVLVNVTIGRRLNSVILTIFLPTLLLNLIGHTANYFKEFFFEGIISLNVTVMLVLTTMFINVSNNLPKTAYLKMIDAWLLFNLVKPFVDIIMQTYIETLRDGDKGREVNHHGKTVKVGENLGVTSVMPFGTPNAKM